MRSCFLDKSIHLDLLDGNDNPRASAKKMPGFIGRVLAECAVKYHEMLDNLSIFV